MWMQMIHRALWFFKSLGRWKMCVAFEARHHAATKWSKFAKKKREMWNSSVQKQRLFWPLRHFYHLGKPNSIHALWLTPSGLRNQDFKGSEKTSFRLELRHLPLRNSSLKLRVFRATFWDEKKLPVNYQLCMIGPWRCSFLILAFCYTKCLPFCEQILSIKNHKNRSISAGGRAKRDRAPCQPVGTFQRGGVVDKKRWRIRSDTPLPLRFYMEIIPKMRLEKGNSVWNSEMR